MVKDHSDRERGNPVPPLNGLLFPISCKGFFICRITHTKAFVNTGAPTETRNTSMDHNEGSIRRSIAPGCRRSRIGKVTNNGVRSDYLMITFKQNFYF